MVMWILGKIDELLVTDVVIELKLEQLKLTLKEKLETLKQFDAKIHKVTGNEELGNEIEKAEEFKDNFYVCMLSLDLESSTMPLVEPPVSTPPPRNQIRLPKLTIEPFDGEITKWTPFWDSYNLEIHNNSGLSDVNKFTYLHSLLLGAP